MLETELYEPIKLYLERLGFEVKAEVGAADVVAKRDDDVLVVEMKTGFSLTLLRQAVARQAITDAVYVAVPRWKGKAARKAFVGNVGLCRRLGLGVLSVRVEDGTVELHADPGPFVPRKSRAKKARLLGEFARREGDPNRGGTRGQVMTAYRQEVLRCLDYLREHGASKGADVARATSVAAATRMMRDNHYGWFVRVSKGVYDLSSDAPQRAPQGGAGLSPTRRRE